MTEIILIVLVGLTEIILKQIKMMLKGIKMMLEEEEMTLIGMR